MSNQRRAVPPDVLSAPAPTPSASSQPAVPASTMPRESAPSAENLLAEIDNYGRLIAEIAATLNLSDAQLAAGEALERLETTLGLPVEGVALWDEARVTVWFAALGGDLQIDLRLSGLDSQTTAASVVLRAGRDPAGKLRDFVASAASTAQSQGNELTVEVRVSVAKGRAAAAARSLLSLRPEYFGSAEMLGHTRVIVFYSSAAWQRLLTPGTLLDWESLGLAREGGRTVVVLCDAAGYLAGLALEVIGASMPVEPRWLAVSRSAWRQFQERSRAIRGLHDEESQWATAPRTLTPAHLRVEERHPGLQPSRERLAGLRAALSALYLASAVHHEQGELVLRFAGPRPAATHIALSEGNASGQSAGEMSSADGALARLCDWAYDNVSPDKLTIARECVARELAPGATTTLSDLESAAAFALDAARANFVLYLRRNTEQYFQVRQQALDTVSAYATGVRKAVADLTGDVVDNVYRTVGLLVGVVIAALLQPSLSLDVQRLAALLYTLYIAFVVVFVLNERRRHFALESADLDTRLSAMPELSASERERLRGQAHGNDTHFKRYFDWSRAIYLGLGVVGLIYLLLLLTPLATHLPLTTQGGTP